MNTNILKGFFFICGCIGFFAPIAFYKDKGIGIIVGIITSSTGLIGIYQIHKYENEKKNFDDDSNDDSNDDDIDNDDSNYDDNDNELIIE